jgi:hypothetical protein
MLSENTNHVTHQLDLGLVALAERLSSQLFAPLPDLHIFASRLTLQAGLDRSPPPSPCLYNVHSPRNPVASEAAAGGALWRW